MIRAAVILLALALASTDTSAHGAGGMVSPSTASVVEFRYATGEPMAFAAISIAAPSGQAYQIGRADGGGRFAFVPDAPGTWTISALDDEKHEASISLDVGPDKTARRSYQRVYDAVLLVSLLGNLVAGLHFARAHLASRARVAR